MHLTGEVQCCEASANVRAAGLAKRCTLRAAFAISSLILCCRAQLLGLRGRDSYLDPQILAAYESLAAEPIEEGFSQRASDGRMLLLEEVFQDLRRSKGRGSIQSKGIDVEWNLLPGALALLQEVRPTAFPPAPRVLLVHDTARPGYCRVAYILLHCKGACIDTPCRLSRQHMQNGPASCRTCEGGWPMMWICWHASSHLSG